MKNHSELQSQWRNTERFSPKIENKARMPAFTTSVQQALSILARAGRQEREKACKLERKK